MRILLTAFSLEIVLGGHDAGLVIAPQHEHLMRVLDLECHEKDHHLDCVYAAVHVVPQKQQLEWQSPVVFQRLPVFEDLHEVVELPVYIADDQKRILCLEQIWLLG